MTVHRCLRAGPLLLDLLDERLWRNGEAVPLHGKPLVVLRLLMDSPQMLVTKDRLLELGWPGVTVSESVLTTAVKELRQALGDRARTPEFVETVHGRGYRFLLDVEPLDALPAVDEPTEPVVSPPARTDRPRLAAWAAIVLGMLLIGAGLVWWISGSKEEARPAPGVVAPARSDKSIAVLPFDDLSPHRDQRWFTDGLTEEVLNSLARLPDLRVASRTSAVQAKTRGLDMVAAARALNVAHVLEGSVRREAGRIRVTAQLIRASDGSHLWSQNFDRPESGVIAIQEEIAFAIASALRTVLDPASLRAMTAAGTRSVEAYNAYLRGLSLHQQQMEDGDAEKSRQASDAFELARRLDPNFARAHWQAAEGWFGRETRVDARARGARLANAVRLKAYHERVDAAIANSRDAVDTLAYRAAKAVTELRPLEAKRLMQDYVRQRPLEIEGWIELIDIAAYADDRPLMGRAAERVHSLSMQGNNPLSRAITASVLSLHPAEAAQRARAQLKLRPDNALIQFQAHRALLWAGAREEARRLLPGIRASRLPDDSRLLAGMRQACADGDRAGATTLRAQLQSLPDTDRGSRWLAATLLGDRAGAKAVLAPLDTEEGLPTLLQFTIYPMFDPADYPVLSARLRAEGMGARMPVLEPYACR